MDKELICSIENYIKNTLPKDSKYVENSLRIKSLYVDNFDEEKTSLNADIQFEFLSSMNAVETKEIKGLQITLNMGEERVSVG